MGYIIEEYSIETPGIYNLADAKGWKAVDGYVWMHRDLAAQSRNIHQRGNPAKRFRVKQTGTVDPQTSVFIPDKGWGSVLW